MLLGRWWMNKYIGNDGNRQSLPPCKWMIFTDTKYYTHKQISSTILFVLLDR